MSTAYSSTLHHSMSCHAVSQQACWNLCNVQAGSRAGADLRYGDSQLNPVQSVSDGGFFSAAGGASGDDSDLGEECGLEPSKLDAQGTDVESSYASAVPVRHLTYVAVSCTARIN
jgi:hypothetical protein